MEEVEPAGLADVLQVAVREWCRSRGGFPIGFVVAADFIDGEGTRRLTVATGEDQPAHASLGLSEYMRLWFADDCQGTWSYVTAPDDEAEED